MSCFKWILNLETSYTPYWESLLSDGWFTNHATILIEGMPDGGGEYLLFSSVYLNKLDDKEEVLELARKKIKYLNGLLYFLNLSDEPLQLGYSLYENSYYDSKKTDYNFIGKLNFFFELIEKGNEELNPKLDVDCFAKVIRIFAKHKQIDFDDLYKIWELTNSLKQTKNKTSEIRNFTHTANHPGAIGDSARHGLRNTEPPSKPMSINEARELIKRESQELFESIFSFKIENKTSYPKFDVNKINWDEVFRNK